MVQGNAALYAPRISTPSSPEKAMMDHVQDLSQAFSLRLPIAAEVVNVENNCALFLDQALSVTSPLTRHTPVQLDEVENNILPYFRPNRRISYRTFYNSKRRRGEIYITIMFLYVNVLWRFGGFCSAQRLNLNPCFH